MLPDYMYEAYVTRLVDGDTMDVNMRLAPQGTTEFVPVGAESQLFDMGFGIWLPVAHMGMLWHTRVRLAGIDAWEIKGSERDKGLAALEYAKSWLEVTAGNVVWLRTEKERGKYGRYVAWIYPNRLLALDHDDGARHLSLNYQLVQEGHGEYASY